MWLKDLLKDAWEHGKKTLLGFSIDARGSTSKNPDGTEKVEEIHYIDEVTPVTHPAAGGRLIRLLAGGTKNMDWLKKAMEILKDTDSVLLEGLDEQNVTGEQEVEILRQ